MLEEPPANRAREAPGTHRKQTRRVRVARGDLVDQGRIDRDRVFRNRIQEPEGAERPDRSSQRSWRLLGASPRRDLRLEILVLARDRPIGNRPTSLLGDLPALRPEPGTGEG